MKDEHDKRTGDLLGLTDQERMRLDSNEKLGVQSWLPVSLVARQFMVTPRRIRALLAQGRLKGRQQENGYWEVAHPYYFAMGTRGPQLMLHRPKKPVLKLV